MKIKPHEWHYSNDDANEEWYTILAYQYQNDQCGTIYDGYRIINLGDNVYELLLCDAHMGIFNNVETAKLAAFKHWETIVRNVVYD